MILHFGGGSPSAAFASIVTQQQHQPYLQQLFPIHRHSTTAHHIAKGFANYGAVSRLLPAFSTTSTILHVNPIAIMGGAASTVAVNTDILTTPAIITMILLALQYCAQPPITRKFLDSRANKKGVTMVEEIVKIALSAFFFFSCGKWYGNW